MHKRFFKFLGNHVKEKNEWNVSACFFENIYLLVKNIVSEAVSEFMSSFSPQPLVDFRLCFSVIGLFTPTFVSQPAPELLSGSQAASCKHYQGQIAAVEGY